MLAVNAVDAHRQQRALELLQRHQAQDIERPKASGAMDSGWILIQWQFPTVCVDPTKVDKE
jgi:hypothetical protein